MSKIEAQKVIKNIKAWKVKSTKGWKERLEIMSSNYVKQRQQQFLYDKQKRVILGRKIKIE